MITIVQPFIPHYRVDFFKLLNKKIKINLLCVRKPSNKEAFNINDNIAFKTLKTMNIGPLTLFNPMNKELIKNTIIVICWDPRWISLYLLLIINKVFKKNKICIWTHGTNKDNSFDKSSIRDKVKLFFFNLAEGIIFYTKNELDLISPYLKKTNHFFLNNTLNVEKIISQTSSLHLDKNKLKKHYNILSKRIVIFSARFTRVRRADILIRLVELMKNDDITWIIIGNGSYKPNFSDYKNVKDYGALYDVKIKAELFYISDFCFLPAWTGLTIVESFAYGIPFITLEKSNVIKHSVEYNYLINNYNGIIAEDINQVKDVILKTDINKQKKMKNNCLKYVKKNLTLDKMLMNFIKGVEGIKIA